MIRIKMSIFKRIQNFLFLDDGEIFWTSASLTIKQRIKRWWNKDKSQLCNTSRGFTLPLHGQNIRSDGVFIYHDLWNGYKVYSLTDGRFIEFVECKTKLPKLDFETGKVEQGLCFNPKSDCYDKALFGTKGKDSIEVRNINGSLESEIFYNDIKEGHWLNYEAEGMQYLNGDIWIGISVKTYFFGAILNYRLKL